MVNYNFILFLILYRNSLGKAKILSPPKNKVDSSESNMYYNCD